MRSLAIATIETRRTEWVQAANNLLRWTGISFERWQRIVEALDRGSDPSLERQEEGLLRERLLVRTYRLGE